MCWDHVGNRETAFRGLPSPVWGWFWLVCNVFCLVLDWFGEGSGKVLGGFWGGFEAGLGQNGSALAASRCSL